MTIAAVGLAFMALFVGMILPVQFAINSQLARVFGSALPAAAISFLVGTLVLLCLTLLTQREWPGLAVLKSTPLYVFWQAG